MFEVFIKRSASGQDRSRCRLRSAGSDGRPLLDRAARCGARRRMGGFDHGCDRTVPGYGVDLLRQRQPFEASAARSAKCLRPGSAGHTAPRRGRRTRQSTHLLHGAGADPGSTRSPRRSNSTSSDSPAGDRASSTAPSAANTQDNARNPQSREPVKSQPAANCRASCQTSSSRDSRQPFDARATQGNGGERPDVARDPTVADKPARWPWSIGQSTKREPADVVVGQLAKLAGKSPTAGAHYDLFISHAVQDAAIANTLCADFEKRGVRCWIAPRDIARGDHYATSMLAAIGRCRAMLLIFEATQIPRSTSCARWSWPSMTTFQSFRCASTRSSPPVNSNTCWQTSRCSGSWQPGARKNAQAELCPPPPRNRSRHRTARAMRAPARRSAPGCRPRSNDRRSR